jgi:hypothetical protein
MNDKMENNNEMKAKTGRINIKNKAQYFLDMVLM